MPSTLHSVFGSLNDNSRNNYYYSPDGTRYNYYTSTPKSKLEAVLVVFDDKCESSAMLNAGPRTMKPLQQ